MKFSLILATIGRTEELKRFLTSLHSQTYRDYELIVVDQNSDNRLQEILQPYKDCLSILHLRSAPGLSRARNVGLEHISGDIVAFPDDDCWYSKGVLERAFTILKARQEYDGLLGRVDWRKSFDDSVTLNTNLNLHAESVTRLNVLEKANSNSLFFRKSLIYAVGEFDETLGVGAGTPWGGGEDIDYPLRALAQGFKLSYEPTLIVCHPELVGDYRDYFLRRAYRYEAGAGRVLRKHNYPFWFVGYKSFKSLGGAVLSLLQGKTGKAQYHWAACCGRVQGWSKQLPKDSLKVSMGS